MKRTIEISVDVEDGESVLVVAMLTVGVSLSIARKAEKTVFGAIAQQYGPNDRPVTMKYGEPHD